MLTNITLIFAGLILAAKRLNEVPVIGESLQNFAKQLSAFHLLIGGFALSIGVFQLFAGGFFRFAPILLIVTGLLLLLSELHKVPNIGTALQTTISSWQPHDYIIGFVSIVVGIVRIF